MRLKTDEAQVFIRGYQTKTQFKTWVEDLRTLKQVKIHCNLKNEKYTF